MAEALDYARPLVRRYRLLALAAVLSSVYPLLVVASLYGEWLLSCYALGRPPRMKSDDPNMLPYWMPDLTAMALVGVVPVLLAAVSLNLLHAKIHRPPPRNLWLGAAAWGGLFTVLLVDPVGVFRWWLD